MGVPDSILNLNANLKVDNSRIWKLEWSRLTVPSLFWRNPSLFRGHDLVINCKFSDDFGDEQKLSKMKPKFDHFV